LPATAFRNRLPDLILCDVKMDKMDGYATLTALRDDPATAIIPFILMTAMAERNGMRQGMLLGADDYLPKPFSVDDLVATVNARLTKQDALQRRADQKLAGFCSNISFCLPHALLTPLNGIMGFSELLRTDAASHSVEDTVEMADAINQSARQLHRVIQNYLILAQAELASTDDRKIAELRCKRTVITRLMLGSLAGEAARGAQRVQDISVEATEARVIMSEDHFRKVVLELIANALRFSTPGTPVRLATKVDADGFALSVSDRGVGMTAEQIALVGPAVKFEQRLVSEEGAGLGLVLARRLAELHGGCLSIYSEVGRGTTVEVRLPAVGA
jgi:two-component system, sensor histidine kinase and response regulator